MGAAAEVMQRYQGVEKQSSGFRLLSAMGWKEGEGLGIKKQGIKEHVKVRKKHDSAGVGVVEAAKQARDWTLGMAAFDRVLAALNQSAAPPAGGTSPAPVAPAGKALKKKRRQAGIAPDAGAAGESPAVQRKVRRKAARESAAAFNAEQEAAQESANAEAAGVSAPAAVLRPDPSAPKAAMLRAGGSHLARFMRRRIGKDARSYSGADLAAILGAAPGSSSSGLLDSSGDGSGACPPDGAAAPPVASDWAPAAEVEVSRAAEESDKESAWWRGYFVRAGRLGSQAQAAAAAATGLDSAKPRIKVAGFSEDDQTNLYMAAHVAGSKGRQGLGVAGRPKKVAGARWEGTKTRLDRDDQAGADASAADAGEAGESPDDAEHVVVLPARAQRTAGTEGEPACSAARLRKLVRKALRAAPRERLKPANLLRRVTAAGAGGVTLDALLAAVNGSAKLALVGGRVVLTATSKAA